MLTASPRCPTCQGDTFSLWIKREEAVAAVRCTTCAANFLLLDSQDYWFDVIQQGYPRVTRCSCKSESFRLRVDYRMREDGDVNYVEVHSLCGTCGKTRRQLHFDVDYSGTDHLVKKPLVPCKNPRILYDLKDLNLLVLLPDMLRLVDHLADAGCVFFARVREGDHWVSVHPSLAQVKDIIQNGWYHFLYAMPSPVEIAEDSLSSVTKENAFWKRSEVIRIGRQYHVCTYLSDNQAPRIIYSSTPPDHASYTEVGLSFTIEFSNEFVLDEQVVQKSEPFRQVTAAFLALLQQTFVSWRSSVCFDNPDVNLRIYGDHYQKKAKKPKKPK